MKQSSQPQSFIKKAKIPCLRKICCKQWLFLLLLTVCLSQSGCELLSLPGEIIGGMFGLAGQALGVASTLPMPPPWMFF